MHVGLPMARAVALSLVLLLASSARAGTCTGVTAAELPTGTTDANGQPLSGDILDWYQIYGQCQPACDRFRVTLPPGTQEYWAHSPEQIGCNQVPQINGTVILDCPCKDDGRICVYVRTGLPTPTGATTELDVHFPDGSLASDAPALGGVMPACALRSTSPTPTTTSTTLPGGGGGGARTCGRCPGPLDPTLDKTSCLLGDCRTLTEVDARARKARVGKRDKDTKKALKALKEQLKKEFGVTRSDLGDVAKAWVVFADQTPPSSTDLSGFVDAAKAQARAKLEKDKADGKITDAQLEEQTAKAYKLLDQLTTLGKVTTDETLTDAQKTDIVENAVVGLVGEVASKDAEELAGEVKTLLDLLRGKKTQKQRGELLKKKLPALAGKLAKLAGKGKAVQKGVKELTEQLETLVKLAFGDPLSAEEKAAIFNQAVLGLLERTVFNGFLNPLYLKAATAGYDFAKPFGMAIERGLRTAASKAIWTAALPALQGKEPDYLDTIAADHSHVVQFTIQSGSYGGWTGTAYWDDTVGHVVVKVVPGTDTAPLASTRAFIRSLFGSPENFYIYDPTCNEAIGGVLVSGPAP